MVPIIHIIIFIYVGLRYTKIESDNFWTNIFIWIFVGPFSFALPTWFCLFLCKKSLAPFFYDEFTDPIITTQHYFFIPTILGLLASIFVFYLTRDYVYDSKSKIHSDILDDLNEG